MTTTISALDTMFPENCLGDSEIRRGEGEPQDYGQG